MKKQTNFLKRIFQKFNKKFAIEPKNKATSFMELPEYVNLDYLLSVKYTRTVDVSNCISISGTTFVIDTKRNSTQKENRSMYKQENRLKSTFNNRWYKIIPISNSNNKSLKSNDSIEAIIQQFIYYNCLKNERLSA